MGYQIGQPLTLIAGSFVIGTSYRIQTLGTTDFTLVGASSNTVGIDFTATGVGAGSGTVRPTKSYAHVQSDPTNLDTFEPGDSNNTSLIQDDVKD
jgi:hypothetical protein